ncbi:MAG TPA: HisA/HisF-related TIM barrel protein [Solirubrobacteraceae bacterium]|jgi:dihydroorotate dehydrogenase (NAD+) catalytic subunit|nr:HisA/HisF-related TIM barrel protein [Solirubrobacteraceae bacterium]
MRMRERRREPAIYAKRGDSVSIEFCGLTLAHPIINGSGTFDAIAAQRVFGAQLHERFPFAAYVSKTITLEPRAGNPPPRLWETPAGLINSIGLPNKGLERYLAEDLPALAELPVPLITNVMGASAEELSILLDACDARAEIAAIELNVSCPNVKTGLDIGADPVQLEEVMRAVRPCTGKPLIVKLTPNTADVGACALGAERGGADALSLINTLRATALAPRARRAPVGDSAPRDAAAAWLGGGTGGLSGPAIRAVALAQVAAVATRVTIPVIGMGGVQSVSHAQDLLDLGATLVAVGTESFRDPAAAARIAEGLHEMATRRG